MKEVALMIGLFPVLVSFLGKPVQPLRLVETPMVSLEGEAQGTTYHIKYPDDQQRNFKRAIDSILVAIDECLSTYRPDSEISRFNRAESHRFERPYFYPVLKKSAEVYEITQGAFDPTVKPLAEAYEQAKKSREPWLPNVDSLLDYVGFQYIRFDAVSVRKLKKNVRLDFNALAQGYTVDVLAEFLETNGIDRYMVEVGGELRCRGQRSEGQWWKVGVESPVRPGGLQTTIRLANRAMATSGNYRNYYRQNGETFGHIINPKTGFSRPDALLSATVFAKDAMTADAFATAFLVMGLDETRRFLARHRELDAYLIYKDEKGALNTVITDGMKGFVD
ncbi:thiamine biosynthesis lipoprotein [Larkinella arboricola]|uniref:FAD:protein FMN transferase n=1 Tax=Larkinella arboricola TaxID=643671 RepID=A0A327X4Q0_LARAB|nr:FAD:protein FMN transferase [Larkinella arboricola]RAK01997.1 thiamine biosynthesis lipoprotein [Larkinella arboricola]